jgi:hypothetical protein
MAEQKSVTQGIFGGGLAQTQLHLPPFYRCMHDVSFRRVVMEKPVLLRWQLAAKRHTMHA